MSATRWFRDQVMRARRLPPIQVIIRLVTSSSRFILFVACTWLVGCSSDEAPDSAGSGGNDATPIAGTGGMPPLMRCPEGPDAKTDTEVVTVGVVSGQIVEENGESASAGLVQICGKNICINANVDDSGKLSAGIHQAMDAPACKYGDGRTFGKIGFPIGGGDSDLGTLTTVRLPGFEDGAPLLPGETTTSAGVSLTLAVDAKVEIDILTYEDESEHGFRAVRLPEEALTRIDQGFVLGFAVAPVETRICPSPSLAIENSIELTAGTELELYILGLDVLEEWAPYAGWRKVGEGRVSNDGTTLDFPDGVPLLTAIGIRERR